jgi:UDP-GlcNAc:undecaprenyl-phosphate GlcNAc-1-phosphate transferase
MQSLPAFLPILLPFLVLLFPFVDLVLSIIRRLVHGQSPFKPDKKHIHHRMMLLGHSQHWAVLILYMWSFLVGFGAILMLIFNSYYVLVGLGGAFVLVLGITFGPAVLRHFRKKSHGDSL